MPGLPNSITDITNNSSSNSNANNILTRAASVLNSATQGRIDTAVFSASAFSVVLSALESQSEAQLISNPTVVTLNNTPATINIGDEFPIPNFNYNEERGTFEVSGFDFKPIGINLQVTPHVNSAGFIDLNIRPEVSSLSRTVSFGGAGGAQIPVISTRKTESTITIKDGYTLAIGGLIEKTTQTRITEEYTVTHQLQRITLRNDENR